MSFDKVANTFFRIGMKEDVCNGIPTMVQTSKLMADVELENTR